MMVKIESDAGGGGSSRTRPTFSPGIPIVLLTSGGLGYSAYTGRTITDVDGVLKVSTPQPAPIPPFERRLEQAIIARNPDSPLAQNLIARQLEGPQIRSEREYLAGFADYADAYWEDDEFEADGVMRLAKIGLRVFYKELT